MRRLGEFLWVKFLSNIIFWGGGGSKILIFWGYEDFVDIFGGHDKIGLVLGVSNMYLRVFFVIKVNVQNENIFAWKKIQIFFWVLDIPDIFWRQTVDEEKVRVPPPHTHTPTPPHTHTPWVTVYDEKLQAR